MLNDDCVCPWLTMLLTMVTIANHCITMDKPWLVMITILCTTKNVPMIYPWKLGEIPPIGSRDIKKTRNCNADSDTNGIRTETNMSPSHPPPHLWCEDIINYMHMMEKLGDPKQAGRFAS